MKIFAEKEAENFLKREGFDVIDTIFIKRKSEIKNAIKKIGFPLVMKVSGKKILHKNEIGGVKIGIKNYKQALNAFNSLMRIKNSEGVLLQRKIHGTEYLLGVKSAEEFGHAVAFGLGGTEVEKMKRVAFRICPLCEKDVIDMLKETQIRIKKENLNPIKNNIMKLCNFVKKYPDIKELDINPLIVEKGKAKIVDARIVFG
jgi:succinyl-CoA synthetase beta subunit